MDNDLRIWKPDLGGWLTMLNGIGLIMLVLFIQTEPSPADSPWSWFYMASIAILASPLGWLLAFSSHTCGPTIGDIIWRGIVLGLNSFVWGYGIVWVFNGKSRRQSSSANSRRGS